MDNNKNYTCCFFGHRHIAVTDELKERLYNAIAELIEKNNVSFFLFGSRSEFDELCYDIVSNLKKIYTHIKRIYIRGEFPDITSDYEKLLLTYYESTYFPEKLRTAGRAVYVERNRIMIDNSSYCIVYYDKKYVPQSRKALSAGRTGKSGTAIAFDYAVKKGCNINNLN